jgi:hypothetical protein
VANGAPTKIDAAYNEVRPVLREDALALMVAAAEPVRVGDLMARLGEPSDRAWFTLLWLIKYDLLRVAPRG